MEIGIKKSEDGPQRGENLVLPQGSDLSKLPLPRPPERVGHDEVPPELKRAWTEYMITGLKQNEEMFQSTLAAFMKPYRLTVWFYATMFVIGIGLFVAAAAIALAKGSAVTSIAFAGLSVGSLLTFFVRQPLRTLEENLECITWLGVAFNTYWTRLMYANDPETVQEDLKAAEDDFRASVEKLIAAHNELRTKRPS